MSTVLIIIEAAPDDWALLEWKKNGLDAEIIFKKVNKVLRGIRRVWIKCHLPFMQIWYAGWKNRVKRADIIIVHMSYITLDICMYLNKMNVDARVIAWYWNSVDNNNHPDNIRGKCEKWSFDPENCSVYNMNFNHQYYFKSFIEKSSDLLWDIYFCGGDAWRGESILKVYKACQEQGIHSKFQVVYPKSDLIPPEIIFPRVSYDEIRSNITKSKAILELTRKGQSGATIRLMEAIFFGKKLVTDNPNVKNEDFYDENNIFLLNERPIEELANFLNGEFIPYEKELLDKYDVKQWVQNFIEGGTIK